MDNFSPSNYCSTPLAVSHVHLIFIMALCSHGCPSNYSRAPIVIINQQTLSHRRSRRPFAPWSWLPGILVVRLTSLASLPNCRDPQLPGPDRHQLGC